MISAGFDTNVLAFGFVRSHPSAASVLLLDVWRKRVFTLIVSEHILAELTHTLEGRYFRQRLTADEIIADIALLQNDARMTALTTPVSGVATHPEDDLILATAVSAQADYLVTGDTKLQELGTYRSITILTPRAFLNLLTSQTEN